VNNIIFRAERRKYLTTTKLAMPGAKYDDYNVYVAPGHFTVVGLRMKLASFSLGQLITARSLGYENMR
jgi:hypothetical protein